MAHPRKFRFGVQLATAKDGAEWAASARRYEDLGFSTLFLPDHFGDQLAPLPAMMAAADATTELRVGCLVFDNDYKHPVVLAKEIATVDVLSGGRVEFGLGAGWLNTDYVQAGIVKERDGVRIAKMAEALEIFKGLWADGPCSFKGEHYTIRGLDGLPKPVQRPGPPILIGGGGPKVLGIAAKYADIIGINPSIPSGQVDLAAAQDAMAERIDQKLQWVKDAAGDRFDDIELNMLVFLVNVTDDQTSALANMAPLFGVEPDQLADAPMAWIGSEEQIIHKLHTMRERWGMSYFVLQKDGADAMANVVAKLTGT
jgi:probable F420-dependent oxidoreductase